MRECACGGSRGGDVREGELSEKAPSVLVRGVEEGWRRGGGEPLSLSKNVNVLSLMPTKHRFICGGSDDSLEHT